MIEIQPYNVGRCNISVPGSKSYTHRALIAAALSDGYCEISGWLKCEDTLVTCSALTKVGVSIFEKNNKIVVLGVNGVIGSCDSCIYLANSGTTMRFFTALVGFLGYGIYVLTGSNRMCKRPIYSLVDAMNNLGLLVYSLNHDKCLPLRIVVDKINSDFVCIDCGISSQYLSALLLIAPCIKNGLRIIVTNDLVSCFYVDMTINVMNNFGVFVKRSDYSYFDVPRQIYKAGKYVVEPDCTHACYFWAAAAITGGEVNVQGINIESKQGDLNFVYVLERMGCLVFFDNLGVGIVGGTLVGVEVCMSDMPDVIPVLAVVASFANGTTIIKGVSNLRFKESNRVQAVVNGLRKLQIDINIEFDRMIINGGGHIGADIETYDDHRIAMSFALVGLKISGVKILSEYCVNKSFPNFWETFKKLYNS